MRRLIYNRMFCKKWSCYLWNFITFEKHLCIFRINLLDVRVVTQIKRNVSVVSSETEQWFRYLQREAL